MKSHLTYLEDDPLWRKTKSLIKHVEPPLKKRDTSLITANDKLNEFPNILSQQSTPSVTANHIFTEHITKSLYRPLQLSPSNTFFNQIQ